MEFVFPCFRECFCCVYGLSSAIPLKMERLISCVLLAFPKHSLSVPFAFPKHSGNEFPVRFWGVALLPVATCHRNRIQLCLSATYFYFYYLSFQVIPRQTCGLYTHTLFLKDYPKGQKKLEYSIHGGELFQVIVNNPVSYINFDAFKIYLFNLS